MFEPLKVMWTGIIKQSTRRRLWKRSQKVKTPRDWWTHIQLIGAHQVEQHYYQVWFLWSFSERSMRFVESKPLLRNISLSIWTRKSGHQKSVSTDWYWFWVGTFAKARFSLIDFISSLKCSEILMKNQFECS